MIGIIMITIIIIIIVIDNYPFNGNKNIISKMLKQFSGKRFQNPPKLEVNI